MKDETVLLNIQIKDTPQIVVHFKGRTTIAVITDKTAGSGVGVATCMKTDKYSRQIGQQIAIARASKDLLDRFETLWVSRSVTKEEYRKKRALKSTKPLNA